MRQKVEIHVSEKQEPCEVLHCRNLHIREKLLRKLFGAEGRLMVLVPSGSVQTVCITDIEDGGAGDE